MNPRYGLKSSPWLTKQVPGTREKEAFKRLWHLGPVTLRQQPIFLSPMARAVRKAALRTRVMPRPHV